MSYFRFFTHFLFFIVILLSACEVKNSQEQLREVDEKTIEESLLKANRYLVRSEEEDINDFIRRYGWKMEKSGTGLRFAIEESGQGMKASYGQKVVFEYTLKLLTGELVYSSANDGLKSFFVGRGGVEAGLEEGIIMMRKGDRAKFVLPSHLAFGLLGDSERIPPRTTLVYEIHLIDIQ